MKSYQVEIKGSATVVRLYEVKAKNEKEARQLGWEKFTSFQDPVDQIIEYNEDDQVVGVEQI
jgi:hypothetical protein